MEWIIKFNHSRKIITGNELVAIKRAAKSKKA